MYQRWYDRYRELSALLTLLEKVDEFSIELIAQDFIQIILSKYNDKFDNVITELANNPPPVYKRWYDKNYNLHTCIEFIKTLPDDEKEDLINSFIMSLTSFITNVDQ